MAPQLEISPNRVPVEQRRAVLSGRAYRRRRRRRRKEIEEAGKNRRYQNGAHALHAWPFPLGGQLCKVRAAPNQKHARGAQPFVSQLGARHRTGLERGSRSAARAETETSSCRTAAGWSKSRCRSKRSLTSSHILKESRGDAASDSAQLSESLADGWDGSRCGYRYGCCAATVPLPRRVLCFPGFPRKAAGSDPLLAFTAFEHVLLPACTPRRLSVAFLPSLHVSDTGVKHAMRSLLNPSKKKKTLSQALLLKTLIQKKHCCYN